MKRWLYSTLALNTGEKVPFLLKGLTQARSARKRDAKELTTTEGMFDAVTIPFTSLSFTSNHWNSLWFTLQKVLKSTDIRNTSIKMRLTSASVVPVHWWTRESWLTSLLASVCSLTLQTWFQRDKRVDPFLNTVPKAPHPSQHTASLLHLTLGRYSSLLFQDATRGLSVWPPKPEIPIPTESHFGSPNWWPYTDPPLPVVACYCCRKPLPVAAKICVARALFFSRAYSAYPCWDLINSSNS